MPSPGMVMTTYFAMNAPHEYLTAETPRAQKKAF
jgi:hypothetical protein